MKAIVFDTETTGLISNGVLRIKHQPEIIEFYGCVVDLSTEEPPEQELHFFSEPTLPLEANIEKITKITNQMLKGKGSIKEKAQAMRSFLETGPPVIAHNCAYDVEVVELELKRCGMTITWPRKICTVEQTIHIKGKRLKLADLHEYLFGHKHKEAHRANTDVAALVRCCRKLYQDGELE